MQPSSFQSQASVRSSIILAPIIAASLLLLPIYVGGLITENGFSLDNALAIVSLEMWGMAVTFLPAVFLMKRISWRKIMYGALCVMIIAFLIPVITPLSFKGLAVVRFTGGLGAGMAMAITMAIIGKSKTPDRAFALWILAQVFFKVIGIFLISRLLARFGMSGFFMPLLLLCFLALPLVKALPDSIDRSDAAKPSLKWSVKAIAALIGVFIFYIAISAIWANFERIGTWSGFERGTIANILSFTSLASLGGASAAALLAGRVERKTLLALGLVLVAVATLWLSYFASVSAFTLIGLLFAFAWFFSVPFIISSVNTNDDTGQLMVYTNSAIAFGLALGPAIATFLISGEDYSLLTLVGAVTFIAAALLLWFGSQSKKLSLS